MKVPPCSRCKKELPIEQFTLRKSGLRKGETNGYCTKCNRETSREYYDKHKDERRKYRERTKKHHSKVVKDRIQKMRFKILTYYSGNPPKCVCCNESEIVFLTIDHINKDGAKHRRIMKGYSFYKWIIDNNYPEEYQILCMNCNWGKEMNGGTCPHKKLLNTEEQK